MAEKMDTKALVILITLFFMALAGFQDDYLKLKGKENRGLSPRGKLVRQILIALIPTSYAMQTYGTILTLGSKSFDIGFLYPILAVFVVTGASNAYNLTDGLDGLAASVGIPPENFARLFRKWMGVTPAAYRKAVSARAGTS